MNIHFLIIVFPYLFILHEFEEIIFIVPWLNKNNHVIKNRSPNKFKTLINTLLQINIYQFVVIVFEQFLLLIAICFISIVFSWYELFIAIVIGYSIHCVIHVFQTIYLKIYVPATLSAILTLIPSLFIIYNIYIQTPINIWLVIILSIICTILIFINLKFMHKYTTNIIKYKNEQ